MRMNLGRLAKLLFLSLLLPCGLAITLDVTLGLLPWITLLSTLIFIPLATFLVIRATLDEMNRVFEAIAPDTIETETVEVVTQSGTNVVTAV